MPAPLVIPAMLYVRSGEDGRLKLLEVSFGNVSVVQMARAVRNHAACVDARLDCASGTLLRILSIGNLDGE